MRIPAKNKLPYDLGASIDVDSAVQSDIDVETGKEIAPNVTMGGCQGAKFRVISESHGEGVLRYRKVASLNRWLSIR